MSAAKVTIGDRLREERERLGFSQTAFAELAAASRRSQIDWEKKEGPTPNADHLERWATNGADVLYIITGRRAEPGGVSAVDLDLLVQVIEGVEETLTIKRWKPAVRKKAEAIVLLYDHFRSSGKVERGFIERQLRLVA